MVAFAERAAGLKEAFQTMAGSLERSNNISVSTAVRIDLYNQLSALLLDGIPLFNALDKIAERRSMRKDRVSKRIAALIRRWTEAMAEGKTLSEAVSGSIPMSEQQMLSAVEASKSIGAGFAKTSEMIAQQTLVKGMLTKAVISNGFYLMMPIGLFIAARLFMLPTIMDMVGPEKYAAPLIGVLSTWDFFASWKGALILVLLVSYIGATAYFLTRWTGQQRSVFSRFLPGFPLYQAFTGAGTLSSIALLIGAGTPLSDAIRTIQANSTPYVAWELGKATQKLSDGAPQHEALDIPLFSVDTRDLLAIYGQTQDFETAIQNIGRENIACSIEHIDGRIALLRPFVYLGVGGMLLWIYAAMMLTAVNV